MARAAGSRSVPGRVAIPSAKERVYRFLREHSDHKGRVRLSTKQISLMLMISDHDIVKLLWSLQKQDLVSFREAAKTIHNKSGSLTDIRVSRKVER